MVTKSVVVQLKDGSEYGVASAAVAARVYPDGKILGHQDGTSLEAEEASAKKKATAKADAPKSDGE